MKFIEYKEILELIDDKYKEEYRYSMKLGVLKVAVEDDDINIADMKQLMSFARGE